MLKKNHNICFIIPAFNEEKRISKIILNLRKLGEVIVIDDFSSDKTNLIAKKSGAKVIKQKKIMDMTMLCIQVLRKQMTYLLNT